MSGLIKFPQSRCGCGFTGTPDEVEAHIDISHEADPAEAEWARRMRGRA